MARARSTPLVQTARSVARTVGLRARQIALIEWRRAQGWDTKKAEAVLARIEQNLAEKRADLASLLHRASTSR